MEEWSERKGTCRSARHQGRAEPRPPSAGARDMPPRMRRYFNTTGPCDARRHYMLAPERRVRDLLPYVEEEQDFVVHAARQTGKTTAMRAFAERLRGLGYVALWATLEESQGLTELDDAEPLWLSAIQDAASVLPATEAPPDYRAFLTLPGGGRLRAWLRAWSAALPDRGIVLLLDKADVVRGAALVSLLRQHRAGGPAVGRAADHRLPER